MNRGNNTNSPGLAWAGRRARMIDELVRHGVTEARVLEAMGALPRDQFVDAALRESAYELRSLPIAGGQTISSPLTQARMTELLNPSKHARILEVGTGSGYQTAILSTLCKWVFTIEVRAELVRSARRELEGMGFENILFREGDGVVGWREAAPFDGIIVTAGAPKLPERLLGQLGEGGRLVCPVGGRDGQTLVEVLREGDEFIETLHEDCRFVPLRGVEGWKT